MEKMKKIGVKAFKEMTNMEKTGILTHNTLDFEYKTYLTMQDKIDLCNTVLQVTFYNKDNKYIGFDSFRFEVARTFCIIKAYITNLSIPQKKNDEGVMEDDVLTTFNIVSSSNLFGLLASEIRTEFSITEQLLSNAVTDMIERHRISANDNMNDLIDILRRKEEEELINMKLNNRQMEMTLKMIPDDPEKAKKWMEDASRQINDLSNLENFEAIKSTVAKKIKYEQGKVVKEADNNGTVDKNKKI